MGLLIWITCFVDFPAAEIVKLKRQTAFVENSGNRIVYGLK